MNELITIAALTFPLMKNAEHVQFHSNVRNLITTSTTAKLGLSDGVFNPYRDAILKEQDIVNRAAGSLFTAEMDAADKKRCQIFRIVRYKLLRVNYELYEEAIIKVAPTVQKSLLNLYKASVCDLPAQEKTSTMSGFILDCRELLEDASIEALGIDSDLDDLESANIKFGRMYQERIKERSNDPVYSDQLRKETDYAYKVISFALMSIANDPTAENKTKAAAGAELIGNINQVIKEAKDRLAQRLGNKTQEGEGGEGGESTNGTAVTPSITSIWGKPTGGNVSAQINKEYGFEVVGSNIDKLKASNFSLENGKVVGFSVTSNGSALLTISADAAGVQKLTCTYNKKVIFTLNVNATVPSGGQGGGGNDVVVENPGDNYE